MKLAVPGSNISLSSLLSVEVIVYTTSVAVPTSAGLLRVGAVNVNVKFLVTKAESANPREAVVALIV